MPKIPFKNFLPALDNIVLSYLPTTDLAKTSTELCMQIFFMGPADKVRKENATLMLDRLKKLLPQIRHSHLSVQEKDDDETKLKNLLSKNIPALKKVVEKFYSNKAVTNADSKSIAPVSMLSSQQALPAENKKLIADAIYFICQHDAADAGKMLYDLIKKYGDLHADVSSYFVEYGADINSNDILYIAIAKRLPRSFLDKLFEQGLKYPESKDKYISAGGINFLANEAITRAMLERNAIALRFLLEKFPEKLKSEAFWIKDVTERFTMAEYDRERFGDVPYSLDAEEWTQAKWMFYDVIADSFSPPNVITEKNKDHVLIVLEVELKTARTPEDCFAAYKTFMALNYQSEDLKKPVIEVIQAKVVEIFRSSEYVKNFGYHLKEYFQSCEAALAHELFDPSRKVGDGYRDALKARIDEAAELLEPDTAVTPSPK